jgi:hypothetical protein
MKYVKEGNTMHRPEECPEPLYQLMSQCWDTVANNRPTFLEICQRLLPDANDWFRQTSFFCSRDGQEAVITQEQMLQVRREQEEANSVDPSTPLTNSSNGHGGLSDNGHVSSDRESHPMVSFRPSLSVTNERECGGSSGGGRNSKLSMNGMIQRLRNKSGSTSGEA